MFSFHKRIVYLSLVEKGIRQKNVGFARFFEEEKACRIELQLKGLPEGDKVSCPVYLAVGENEQLLLEIVVQAGKAEVKKEFKVSQGHMEWEGNRVLMEEICGLSISLSPELRVEGYFPEIKREQISADKEEPVLCQVPEIDAGGTLPKAEEFFCDKWEQLLKQYPKIHPFGDERTFISIEPKDFIILQASYQKLVNNSFLLHGFYNYHYLILGQDAVLGEGADESFYVGVPGTYFEREKMVAVMFGFEGFECSGAVEVGKFGYYMRKVEL